MSGIYQRKRTYILSPYDKRSNKKDLNKLKISDEPKKLDKIKSNIDNINCIRKNLLRCICRGCTRIFYFCLKLNNLLKGATNDFELLTPLSKITKML